MIEIHPTAVVHPDARLAQGVVVGPYAVIAERVSVGENTRIGAHAVLEPFTTIGRDCQIHANAVVGGISQDKKFVGDDSHVIIGDRNVIREFVTINRATGRGEVTRIGDDNLLMAYVHVAHDCVLGNGLTLSNGVTMGGHVQIEDHATIGGMVGIHQFIRVGAMAMIGGMSKLAQDVPPYALVDGNPPRVFGLNVVKLRRCGMGARDRQLLKRAHRLLYRSGLNLAQATAAIEALEAEALGEAPAPHLRHLLGFLRATERGLVGMNGHGGRSEDSDADDE